MHNTKQITTTLFLSALLLFGCGKDKELNNTISTIPTIVSISPADNSIDIARNVTITAVFSEAMNANTISNNTFIVKQDTNTVLGKVALNGDTATFTPTVSLNENTTYTVSITTGAKNLAGTSLTANKVWSFKTGAVSKIMAVNLKSSTDFVILAKSAINNSSTSNITGDIGLSPAATSYITGFSITNATGYATSAQITGKIYAADMAPPTPTKMTTAVNDMITAYNDAAGRVSPDFTELYTGNIGGRTLTSGLYKWTNSVTIPANLVISGNENDIWIFQISGNLLMSAATRITLVGGAQAKNIYWQIAGQATFGATSHMEGNILSKTGITFQTNATLKGKALAQTAVILDANVITNP